MITNIKETLEEMNLIYSWSENTYTGYKIAIQQYTNFTGHSFEELITEAETDETKINKLSKRRIKKRLIQFQIHLQKQNKTPNTIINYLSRIIKIYKYLDIEVPTLPTIKKSTQETFEDLPTKEMEVVK